MAALVLVGLLTSRLSGEKMRTESGQWTRETFWTVLIQFSITRTTRNDL